MASIAPEKEEAFNRWYNGGPPPPKVLERMPGVLSGRRYKIMEGEEKYQVHGHLPSSRAMKPLEVATKTEQAKQLVQDTTKPSGRVGVTHIRAHRSLKSLLVGVNLLNHLPSKEEDYDFLTLINTSFTVSNMERTIAFYRDVLGVRVLWDSLQAGVVNKGPVCDKITGLPGELNSGIVLCRHWPKSKFRIRAVYGPLASPWSTTKPAILEVRMSAFIRTTSWNFYHKLLANGARLALRASDPRAAKSDVFSRSPNGIILDAIEGPPRVRV